MCQEYVLTLNNIRTAMGSLFKIQYAPSAPAIDGIVGTESDNVCPVKDKRVFEILMGQSFSRDIEPQDTKYMNQKMMVFFMLGGYLKLAKMSPQELTTLFNGEQKRGRQTIIDFSEELNNWRKKNDSGNWVCIKGQQIITRGECSLLEYIIQMNCHLISNYCNDDSQIALGVKLREYSENIQRAEITPATARPIQPQDVERLSKILYRPKRLEEDHSPTELANDPEIRNKYSICLAEGLTWLLIAAILRDQLSSLSIELENAANRPEVIQTEDRPTELYKKLMELFHFAKTQHPSIRMMKPDPALIPSGIPIISNADRTAVEGTGSPVSIKEMIQKSWKESFQKHILLIGEGGIGKTVAMLSLPDEEWVTEKRIPAVYAPLQSLDIYDGKLNNFIREKYGSDSDKIFDLANQQWTDHPRLLLLLDGYNELPDQYRVSVEKQIKEWMNRPGVQLITTSRISFILPGRFLEYRLQPLSADTIRSFLMKTLSAEKKLPDNTDPIWSIINTPLTLVLFAKVDRVTQVLSREEGGIYTVLDWKKADTPARIIWNYLQIETCRCVSAASDVTAQARSAEAILAIAPYVCFEMIKRNAYHLEQEEFNRAIREACQFYRERPEMQNKQVFRIKQNLDNIFLDRTTPFDESLWIDYATILTTQTALFLRRNSDPGYNSEEKIVYVPPHQMFRDAMAAFYAAVCLLSITGDIKKHIPEELLDCMDQNVKGFLAGLLTDEKLEKLWEHHRKSEPENGRATWILMDIIGRQRDRGYDFSNLNFSGLDLTKINLHSLLSKRPDICSLPCNKDRFKGTKIGKSTICTQDSSDRTCGLGYSRDGMSLITVFSSGKIRIRNLENGEDRILNENNKNVISTAFDSESDHLACGLEDGSILIQNYFNGTEKMLRSQESSKKWVTSMAFLPESRLASGSEDGTIRIWNLQTGTCDRLGCHEGWVTSISFNPESGCLASSSGPSSGSEDGTIRIWSLQDKEFRELEGHTGWVTSTAFDLKRNCLVSGSQDGKILKWYPDSAKPDELDTRSAWVTSLVYSSKSDYLAGGYADGMVCIWKQEQEEEKLVFKGHMERVAGTAFDPRRDFLASISDDGTVRIWDLVNEKGTILEGHARWVNSLAYDTEKNCLACGSADGTIRLWYLNENLNDGKSLVLNAQDNPVNSVSFCPGTNWLASGLSDGTIRIWDLQNRNHDDLDGHKDSVSGVAFSIDEKCRLASCSWDGTVRLWNPQSKEIIRVLYGHQDHVTSLAFLTNNLLASSSDDGTIRLWDLEPEETMASVLSTHKGWMADTKIDSESNRLASSPDNQVLQGKWLPFMNGFPNPNGFSSIAYIPEMNSIASGSRDGTVRLWNLDNKEFPVPKNISRTDVTSIVYIPKKGQLAIGSMDGTIRILNLKIKEIEYLIGHEGGVTSITYLPEKDCLASGSLDGTVRIWDLETHEERRRFRIIPHINLYGVDFEEAEMSEEDREYFNQAGAFVRNQ